MDALRALVATGLATLVLAGCGGTGHNSSDEVTATPESLAALVIQYLPRTPASAYDLSGGTKVSSKVTFGKADPPDSIQVTVEKVDKSVADLQRSICVNCDVTEPDPGTTLQISRGDRLPGLGMGETAYVRINRIRDDEIVSLVYDGRPIRVNGSAKGDRLDVDTLAQIVQDPNLGVTTVQGFVDDGDNLSVWTDTP